MTEEDFEKCHMKQIASTDIRAAAATVGVEEAWHQYIKTRHISGRLANSARELRTYFLEVVTGD